jgi:hypothetical protein
MLRDKGRVDRDAVLAPYTKAVWSTLRHDAVVRRWVRAFLVRTDGIRWLFANSDILADEYLRKVIEKYPFLEKEQPTVCEICEAFAEVNGMRSLIDLQVWLERMRVSAFVLAVFVAVPLLADIFYKKISALLLSAICFICIDRCVLVPFSLFALLWTRRNTLSR